MNSPILIVAETINNQFSFPPGELAGAAKILQESSRGKIILVVAGSNIEKLSMETSACLGIEVAALESDNFLYPNPPLIAREIRKIAKQINPGYILLPHSTRMCHAASVISHEIDASCITAVESIFMKSNRPVVRRGIFSGKVKMEMEAAVNQMVLTILSGAFQDAGDPKLRKPNIKKTSIQGSCPEFRPVGIEMEEETENPIDEAEVIVAAGRGLGEEENLGLVRQTAAVFKNSAVAGSRPICDLGWLPYSSQVGETGKIVAPRLYLACGISGASQHIAGMKNSQLKIAINSDPRAAIFSIADFGIVEDLQTFLPILIQKYKNRNLS